MKHFSPEHGCVAGVGGVGAEELETIRYILGLGLCDPSSVTPTRLLKFTEIRQHDLWCGMIAPRESVKTQNAKMIE